MFFTDYGLKPNDYGRPVDFEDGLPLTKKNKNYHGFGVKSMRLIAEKYGGKMYASLKDDIFRVDIVWPHL